jgi:hypothetical protein
VRCHTASQLRAFFLLSKLKAPQLSTFIVAIVFAREAWTANVTCTPVGVYPLTVGQIQPTRIREVRPGPLACRSSQSQRDRIGRIAGHLRPANQRPPFTSPRIFQDTRHRRLGDLSLASSQVRSSLLATLCDPVISPACGKHFSKLLTTTSNRLTVNVCTLLRRRC